MTTQALLLHLQHLYEEHRPSEYPWSQVEPWIIAYIAEEHTKIRNDEWNGLDIAPKEVFRRFSQEAGHPIRYSANGESFSFSRQNKR